MSTQVQVPTRIQMRRSFLARVAAAAACLAGTAGVAAAEEAAPPGAQSKSELSVDIESSLEGAGYGGSITYARRLQSNLLVGGGLGFGWEENRHTFEMPVYETLHLDAFVRWRAPAFVHVDAGLTVMNFTQGDDGSARAPFVGAFVTAGVGARNFCLAARVRAGRGAGENGVIVTPVVLRFMFDW